MVERPPLRSTSTRSCGRKVAGADLLAVDPFLGLGNTGLAAAKLGLDFVGIEMDEHYLKEAVGRIRASL